MRRPTPEQRMIIAKAGLHPADWLVRFENGKWLALVDRGFEKRRTAKIDLDTLEIKMPWRRPKQTGQRKIYYKVIISPELEDCNGKEE